MKIYLDALSKGPTVSIGTQALIIGSIEIISKYFKDAQIVMLSSFPEVDKAYLDKESYRVELVQRCGNQVGAMCNVREILGRVDCIVSAWGDGYITTPPHKILQKTVFLKKHNKSLILFPSSIGPFYGKIKRILSYLGLKRFDKIMVRDTVTLSYLNALGLREVTLVPDSAFVLSPAGASRVNDILSIEHVPENVSCIGLNVSQLLNRLCKDRFNLEYPKLITRVVNYLKETFKRHVLLIPHQIIPNVYKISGGEQNQQFHGDDRQAINDVMRYIDDKSMVIPVLGEYSCREYKGIIGRCEMFIGGRMHSVIAAVSMGVPAVIMQYSHKATGVMDMLGLKSYVWDISSSEQELIAKINDVWNHRIELREHISTKMKIIKHDADAAGTILEKALKK